MLICSARALVVLLTHKPKRANLGHIWGLFGVGYVLIVAK